MDDKKQKQIESLLESLSEEQIEQLESLLQKSSVTSRTTRKKRRRGKGRRKKRERQEAKEKAQEEAEVSEDFIAGIKLTASEKEELREAAKFDKERGVDKAPERPPKVKRSCFVEMKCRICGKTQNISPGLVPPEPSRYKCNTCACSAG